MIPPVPDLVVHKLWNTRTGTAEACQLMTPREAEQRNEDLRAHHEPQRWVPEYEDEVQP